MICDLSILQSLYNLTTVLDPRYKGIQRAPEHTGMWGPIFGRYTQVQPWGWGGRLRQPQRLVPEMPAGSEESTLAL